jgi:hypothetical protein
MEKAQKRFADKRGTPMHKGALKPNDVGLPIFCCSRSVRRNDAECNSVAGNKKAFLHQYDDVNKSQSLYRHKLLASTQKRTVVHNFLKRLLPYKYTSWLNQ